ncbi:MAG TPA: Enamidase, partial [Candidatus Limnocylindria bacterium]|nr:Enamidase [Candidatus Limnocylindria bacterium]
MGALVTGILGDVPRAADVLVVDGRIAAIGAIDRAGADVVVDCRGTTVIPGLIDSHCHVVLG